MLAFYAFNRIQAGETQFLSHRAETVGGKQVKLSDT